MIGMATHFQILLLVPFDSYSPSSASTMAAAPSAIPASISPSLKLGRMRLLMMSLAIESVSVFLSPLPTWMRTLRCSGATTRRTPLFLSFAPTFQCSARPRLNFLIETPCSDVTVTTTISLVVAFSCAL